MAWINLFTNDLWTNRGSPTIYVSLDYDKQRVGADMQYKLRCTINPIGGQNYFGYPIYIKASFDGSELINYTMKNASPSQWSSAIVYESGWVTVSGKVTGTTALTTTIYSGLGSSRSEIYSHALAIDGAPSRLSLSDNTLYMDGSNSCIATITRDSTTFTHTLRVQVGSAYTNYTGLTTTKTFTLPLAWNSQVPNATTISGQATLYTYAGGTLIGTDSKPFTAYVPTNIVPSFSSIGVQRIDGVVPVAWGKYVEGLSKVKLTINSPVGAYGSTIKSYSISGQNLSVTTASGTSDFIKASGTLTYTAKITDSRGRTATKTTSIAVEAYKLPSLSGNTKAYRSDADGASQPISGTSLTVNPIVSSYSIGGLNVDTVTIRYKLANASSFSEAVEVPKNTLSVIYQDLFDIAERYVVQFNIRDSLGANVYVEFTIPSAQRLMNFDSENHAIAFGGFVQEPNLADFQMPVKFSQGVELEEGVWTPTAVNNAFYDIVPVVCKYVKIGKLVFIQGRFTAKVYATTGVRMDIGGFPYSPVGSNYIPANFQISGKLTSVAVGTTAFCFGDGLLPQIFYRRTDGEMLPQYLTTSFIVDKNTNLTFQLSATYIAGEM